MEGRRSRKFVHISTAATAGLLAAGAYLNGKYQLTRDAKAFLKQKRAEKSYAAAVAADRLSPWYMLAETCARQPQDRAIWTREREWTYKEVHDQTVRYAQWLLDEGIKPGDLVAMYLHNSAEFVMLMFATLCIGAGPAMINYNLEGKALLHCLDVAQSKLLIVDIDENCRKRIGESKTEIEGAGTKIVILNDELKTNVSRRQAVVPPDELRNGMQGSWPYALIYTRYVHRFTFKCAWDEFSRRIANVRQWYDWTTERMPFHSGQNVAAWISSGTCLWMSKRQRLLVLSYAALPRNRSDHDYC